MFQGPSGTLWQQWEKVARSILEVTSSDAKIPLLGMVQSLFEAAMYTFVFMWTPSMKASVPVGKTPHTPFLMYPRQHSPFWSNICMLYGQHNDWQLDIWFSHQQVETGHVQDTQAVRIKLSAEEVGRIVLAFAAISLVVPIYASVLFLRATELTLTGYNRYYC